MIEFSIVVAVDEAGGIGREGGLPWQLPGDMEHFRALTSKAGPGVQNTVIMGRRTWESIPKGFRPLPGRRNLVLSRRQMLPLPEGVLQAPSLDEALARLDALGLPGKVFVIGGGMVYRQALRRPGCARIHLTRVRGRFDCDTFFPEIGEGFQLESRSAPHEENGIQYHFEDYVRTARE